MVYAQWKQGQKDHCELEASLVHKVSSRKSKATERNPIYEKPEFVVGVGAAGALS